MRLRSKKNFENGLVAILFAVCVSVAGCGISMGENRPVSGDAVSGSGVSDGAVSESAVRGGSDEEKSTENSRKTLHTEAKQYRYSTDTNVYYEDFNFENQEWIIAQARFDGSHKKKIVADEYDVHLDLEYVDGNWLYYKWGMVGEDTILYRIPLEKDGEGYDVVKTSEEEEVIRAYYICSALWSSHEVLFDNGDGKVIRYDLQKEKTVSEWNYADLGIEAVSIYLLRLKDCFVALTEEGVYAMKVDGTQWKKCKDREKCFWKYGDSSVYMENSLFFAEDIAGDNEPRTKVRIKKCDGKNIQTFITQAQILRAAKRAKQIKTESQIKECSFNDMYVQDDRLYIQLELHWKEDGVYRMEYVLFSQGENETELRYEKKLTESMQSRVKSRKGELLSSVPDVHTNTSGQTVMEKHAVANDAQCVAMLNGKVYLSLYDYETDQGRMGCYDMSTGKFRWVTQKEVVYGELGWSGLDGDYVFEAKDEFLDEFEELGRSWVSREAVFETEEDNPYVGFKGGGGNFVEAE